LHKVLLGWGALAAIGAFCLPPPIMAAEKSGSATTLSAYGDYAKEVSAECVRNRAYGLSTNGLSLPLFCARLGNEQALAKHRQLHPDPQGGSSSRPFP
jgi:hypothetical protein